MVAIANFGKAIRHAVVQKMGNIVEMYGLRCNVLSDAIAISHRRLRGGRMYIGRKNLAIIDHKIASAK